MMLNIFSLTTNSNELQAICVVLIQQCVKQQLLLFQVEMYTQRLHFAAYVLMSYLKFDDHEVHVVQ